VRHGGSPTLTVLVGANDDVRDCVLPHARGGKGDWGLAERVKDYTKGTITVALRHSRAASAEQVLAEIRADPSALADVDVVVISIEADASVTSPSPDAAAARFGETMREIARIVKDNEAHLIVFNGSTYDPADPPSCYDGVESTPALVIHQLNCVLIGQSVLDGLSIIDIDRIMAEIGGRSHVEKPLSYSPHACDVVCDELVRVLDDYGFFENRPLLAQVGRRR
jgi:hypothetical protein